MTKLADYMTSTPDVIYYDYNDEIYTTICPSNTHNYDIYAKHITERQNNFDNAPAQRKWFKDRPSDCTLYKDVFDTNKEIWLYWNDLRTELYRQHTETGHTNIDLALNRIL